MHAVRHTWRARQVLRANVALCAMATEMSLAPAPHPPSRPLGGVLSVVCLKGHLAVIRADN